MHLKLMLAGIVVFGAIQAVPAAAQVAANEQEFQEMVAALKADDGERVTAIAVCIAQGIGDNPAGAAQFMGVPVEDAAKAWCTRTTNGIAAGKLTLSDLNAVNEGTVTPAMLDVLKTASQGE
jgi:hypothetical protein